MSLRHRNVSLAASTVTLAIVYGIWHSYSLVLVALLAEFGWSRSMLAGAFSVMLLVHGAVSPIAGAACSKVPPRLLIAAGGAMLGLALVAVSFVSTPAQLYFAFGVLTAVPLATCGWIPNLVQVQREFRDRLGLAMGIASAGIGVGIFVVVPLFQSWMDDYGWRVAFRIFAAVCAGWIVPTSLLLVGAAYRGAADRSRPPTPVVRGAVASPTLLQVTRTPALWLIVGLYFVGNFAAQTLNTHQAAFFVDHGLTPAEASAIIGFAGAASVLGKIGGGWMSDRLDREIVYIVGISCLVAGIAALSLVDTHTRPWLPFVYATLFGLGYSASSSLLPPMISDRFGGRHFGSIVGIGTAGGALGAALGAWLAGRLFDVTGSYAIPFALAAACGVSAATGAWRARTMRVAANGVGACRRAIDA